MHHIPAIKVMKNSTILKERNEVVVIKNKRLTITVNNETYKIIESVSKQEGRSKSFIIRRFVERGAKCELSKDYLHDISLAVNKQMEVVIKPHVERLAAISSKAGHMAATAAFLNVQAFIDLVPEERRKDANELFQSARKMAVEYMKKPIRNSKYDGGDS